MLLLFWAAQTYCEAADTSKSCKTDTGGGISGLGEAQANRCSSAGPPQPARRPRAARRWRPRAAALWHRHTSWSWKSGRVIMSKPCLTRSPNVTAATGGCGRGGGGSVTQALGKGSVRGWGTERAELSGWGTQGSSSLRDKGIKANRKRF